MKFRLYTTAILLSLLAVAFAEARPRLAVNIVVSGLRQRDITRYEKNYCKDGFLRLRNEGVEFTECYAEYAPTTSEAGLATLATGTTPSTHGIFSSLIFDRTTNNKREICIKDKSELTGMVRKELYEKYTTKSFKVQTLAESALASSERNRAITIAHNALSAMILTGRNGECYWLDSAGKWASALCYTEELPFWVRSYNQADANRVYATDSWYGKYTSDKYRNSRSTTITLYEKNGAKRPRPRRKGGNWVENLRSMPSGNIAIFEFAKRALTSLLPLHIDDECKMLNICLDVPRTIAEQYGADSIEYEDMLYSLDALLAEFLTFLYAQLPSREDVIVTLTSDSGISPTKEGGDDARFDTRQFEVLMNAFLSARYGQDKWVSGYMNGSLYLNHDVIYKHKMSLSEVQNEVAAFALQYRGIASAFTATALRSAQFSRGAAALLQNGYTHRYSGDVMIVLEAERIENDSQRVAMSGSVYGYDRHIPFIISGTGIAPYKESSRISNEQIAPTLARLIGVEPPMCSDATIIVFDEKK